MTREEAIRILDPATTREALIEIEYYAGFSGKEAVRKAVDDACLLAIEALSQPLRAKGRWKLADDEWNAYECTSCKQWWTLESGTPQENEMAFCPYCGASMEGEE